MIEANEQAEIAALRSRIDALDLELGGLSSRLAKLENRQMAGLTGAATVAQADSLTASVAAPAERIAMTADDAQPTSHATPTESSASVWAFEDATAEPTPQPVVLSAKPPFSLEAFIGGQGALWIGSVAVFIALACGLAYAWGNIPPAVRVGAGFLLSAAFLAGSTYTRKRSRSWFADGIAGAGLALAYLDAWSGFSSFGLYSAGIEFLLMGITTVVGAALAIRYDAMAIGVLATLGGFITPYIAGGDATMLWPLFAYVFVLNLFLLVVSFYKRWHPLGWLGLAGTVILAGGTAMMGSPPAIDGQNISVAAWFTGYYLEFSAAAVAFGLRRGEQSTPHDVLMLVATATLYGASTYSLLQGELGVGHALFLVALALACGAVALVVRRLAPENSPLTSAAIGLGIFYATLAAPAQFDANWLAVAWVAEGALLSGLGIKLNSTMLRRAGHIVSTAAALVASYVMLESPGPSALPIFNAHSLPLAGSVLASLFLLGWERDAAAKAPQVHSLWLITGFIWLALSEIYRALNTHPTWASDIGVGSEGNLLMTFVVASIGLTGLAFVLDRASVMWGGRTARNAGLILGVAMALGLAAVSYDLHTARSALISTVSTAWSLALLLGIWYTRRNDDGDPADQKSREALPGLAALTGIWVTSQALLTYEQEMAPQGNAAGSLTLTAAWLAWGLCLMGIGIKSGRGELRRIALGLLTLTAFKVLFVDLGNLPTGERIVASGGLGVVLIITSWLYGRLGKTPQGS